MHSAHLEKPDAQVELLRTTCLAALPAPVGLDVSDVKPLPSGLDHLVTLRQLLAAEVERIPRLAPCE